MLLHSQRLYGNGSYGGAAFCFYISDPVVFLCNPELYGGCGQAQGSFHYFAFHCPSVSGDSCRSFLAARTYRDLVEFCRNLASGGNPFGGDPEEMQTCIKMRGIQWPFMSKTVALVTVSAQCGFTNGAG